MQPDEHDGDHYADADEPSPPLTHNQPVNPGPRKGKPREDEGHEHPRWKLRDWFSVVFEGIVAVAAVPGIYFLIVQSGQTNRALDAAREANRLTRETVTEMRRQTDLIRSQVMSARPLLLPTQALVYVVDTHSTLELSVLNIGNAPAVDVSLKVNPWDPAVVMQPQWPAECEETVPNPSFDPRTILAPNARTKVSYDTPPNLKSGVSLLGCVTYSTTNSSPSHAIRFTLGVRLLRLADFPPALLAAMRKPGKPLTYVPSLEMLDSN